MSDRVVIPFPRRKPPSAARRPPEPYRPFPSSVDDLLLAVHGTRSDRHVWTYPDREDLD